VVVVVVVVLRQGIHTEFSRGNRFLSVCFEDEEDARITLRFILQRRSVKMGDG
jgi:hypothetical protein